MVCRTLLNRNKTSLFSFLLYHHIKFRRYFFSAYFVSSKQTDNKRKLLCQLKTTITTDREEQTAHIRIISVIFKKFIVSHKQLETENLGAPVLCITRHAYLLAKALLQAKRKFFTTFSFMFKDISWSVGQK